MDTPFVDTLLVLADYRTWKKIHEVLENVIQTKLLSLKEWHDNKIAWANQFLKVQKELGRVINERLRSEQGNLEQGICSNRRS